MSKKQFYIMEGDVIEQVGLDLYLLGVNGTRAPFDDYAAFAGNARGVPEDFAMSELAKQRAEYIERTGGSEARDCGTGAGGFKPGNACAKGGGGAEEPEGGYGPDGGHRMIAGITLVETEKINGIEVTTEVVDAVMGNVTDEIASLCESDYNLDAMDAEGNDPKHADEIQRGSGKYALNAWQGAGFKPMLIAMNGELSDAYWDDESSVYPAGLFAQMNELSAASGGTIAPPVSWEDTLVYEREDFADKIEKKGEYSAEVVEAIRNGDYDALRDEDGALLDVHDELWNSQVMWKQQWFKDTEQQLQKVGESISQMAKDTPLDLGEDANLFRGGTLPRSFAEDGLGLYDFATQLAKDGDFQMDNPHSSTKDPNAARSFMTAGQSVMMVFRNPKSGIDMNQVNETSNFASEAEVLLPPQTYKVSKVRVIHSKHSKIPGKTIPRGVIVELVPKEASDVA